MVTESCSRLPPGTQAWGQGNEWPAENSRAPHRSDFCNRLSKLKVQSLKKSKEQVGASQFPTQAESPRTASPLPMNLPHEFKTALNANTEFMAALNS